MFEYIFFIFVLLTGRNELLKWRFTLQDTERELMIVNSKIIIITTDIDYAQAP